MKKLYAFFAVMLMASAAMASNVEVFTHAAYGGEEGTNMRTYKTANFTLVQKKGPAKSDSWFDDQYDDLRLYKNQTLTITAGASVGTIDSVIVNLNIQPQKAEIEAVENNTYTVTSGDGNIVAAISGDAQGILRATGKVNEFVITATSQQMRIATIDFFYSDKPSATPVLKASTDEVDFGSVALGQNKEQTITVEAYNLTEDIVFTETEKSSAISYKPQLTRDGGSIVVSLDASVAGDYLGEIQLSANGLKQTIVVGASVVAAGGDADGSEAHPYSVNDVLTLNNSLAVEAWVEGYIWGVVKSAHALQDTFKDDNSIALGATKDFDADAASLDFVPVQIKDKTIRSEIGLFTNPTYQGRHIMVYGKLEAYFTAPGVKEISNYKWLDNETALEETIAEGITFSNGTIAAKGLIEVYNITGERILSGFGTVDMTAMSQGLYIIKSGDKAVKVIK